MRQRHASLWRLVIGWLGFELCNSRKICSEVYMKGFYSGVLTVGPYAGQKVSEVKDSIKQDLILKDKSLTGY